MAPVCSPTAIICVTMPGKTCESFKGSVSDLPSSSDFLTLLRACSTTALPAVFAVMSKPSRIGTPLEIRAPSVLVNRATAILRIKMPITGRRSIPGLQRKDNPHKPRQEDQPEPAADQVAERDHDPRRQGQRYAQAREQGGENRHHFPQQQDDNQRRDAQHADGVNQ